MLKLFILMLARIIVILLMSGEGHTFQITINIMSFDNSAWNNTKSTDY